MNTTAVNSSQALVYKNSTVPFSNVFQSIRVLNLNSTGPTDNGNGDLYGFPNFTAMECSLNPCVLSLKPSVSQGNYSEIILDTWMKVLNNANGISLHPRWGPKQGVTSNQSFGFGWKILDE
jgi:hypothetical protein